MLLLTVSCCSLTVRCQSDSIVEVQYSRLVKWASLRVVGDSTIRELARDFGRQQRQVVNAMVIIDRDSVIMERQAKEIQGWKDQSAYCDRERAKDRKRAKGAKVWRFLEGLCVGAAVGIILAR